MENLVYKWWIFMRSSAKHVSAAVPFSSRLTIAGSHHKGAATAAWLLILAGASRIGRSEETGNFFFLIYLMGKTGFQPFQP